MAPSPTSPVPPTAAAFFNGSGSVSGSATRGSSRSPPRHSQTQTLFSSSTFEEHGQTTLFRSYNGLASRKMSSAAMVDTSDIARVVYSLKRRGSEQLGSATSAKLLSATHDSIVEWIRAQRMQRLPPEGSSQDKVLAWAQLFVERLHMFDSAIADFAGDSYLATQLAYGYCAILLELGEENAPALMLSFGFFYNMSMSLVNLLERTELFSVSQDVREQLVLALSDLVTLVANVSTHFHKAISGLTSTSVSVNIYGTFPTEIKSFIERCDKTAELMWKHQLIKEGIDADKVSVVKSIKNWVAPNDHILEDAVKSVSHLAHDREELTCLWVAPYLTRFLRGSDSVMSITGPPGSGKTVLASVLVDYMQHPIGGVSFDTIFVPINKRISAETSPIAIAKTILSQLFEKRIGNVNLLEILTEAHERAQLATTEQEYEGIVWNAVERSLAAALPRSKELIMVVDGTDEVADSEALLLKRLTKATVHGTNVKLITLGEKKSAGAAGHNHLQLNEDLIIDDVMRVVRGQFEHESFFNSLAELEQENIIAQLAHASKGSFLWVKQATKRVRQEKNLEGIQKAVDKLIKARPSILDFVSHTLHSNGASEAAKLMVLWLAIADRPLSLKELAVLGSAHMDKEHRGSEQQVVLPMLKPVNSLVFLQDGLIYIRHAHIQAAILDLCQKDQLVPGIKDPHYDLASRLLTYIKDIRVQEYEPSISGLSPRESSQLLNKYPLLDFAVRYWPLHFRSSSLYQKEGEAGAIKTIPKASQPTGILLLQNTIWEHFATPTILTNQHLVASFCRRQLGSKDVATLQSIISVATLYQRIGATQEAISWLYEAVVMSETVLTARSSMTMQISDMFLQMTSSSITESQTEMMSKREKTLLILVECHKTQYGETSETVVTVLQQLAEHYRLVRDEQKAQRIVQTINTITATDSGDREHDLHVHLKSRSQTGQTDTGVALDLDLEERDEMIEGYQSYDFELFLKRAEKHFAEGRTDLAERAYIDIWNRVSIEHSSNHSEVWEQRKLSAVLGYSKFLIAQKRETDASSILSSTWEDYRQGSRTVSDSSVSTLHSLAKTMKSVGLVSASLSLLKRCSQYYQSTSLSQSSVHKEIQQSIQTESRELMQSIGSTRDMTSEEALAEMVWEASNSVHTMDQAAFTAMSHLLGIYTSQRRWQDATRLLKKVLRTVWPSFFTLSVRDVEAPLKPWDVCMDLTERLSECHRVRRRIAKEEDVRMRVYYSLRNSKGVDDKLRAHVTSQLNHFLDRTSQKEKMISIRQEMLEDFTKSYGPENQQVITMLWELAEMTRPRPIFIEYYQKIIQALNKKSDVATAETFEPIRIVAEELWNKGAVSEALPYYRILFTTFLKQPKVSSKMQDELFMRDVFSRYDHCLRAVRSDYQVLHKVASEYRTQCKAVYGANASITMRATLHLAHVCQESRTYEHEAIAMYEELLKTKSTEIDHKEITSILDVMYEDSTDVSTMARSESASATQIARGVTMVRKRIESTRKSYGWAHEESLAKLTELVHLYSKQQDTEKAVSELNTSTVHVLSTETSATRLMAAATTIASGYMASNSVKKAMELKAELYRQLVSKEKYGASSVGFDLTSRGRESLVFLAQFEHQLRHSSATVNDILAELTTQYVYYEEFRSLIKSKTSNNFYNVTAAAARLHASLVDSQRPLAASRVFDEYQQYFMATEAKKLDMGADAAQVEILMRTLLQYFAAHTSRDFVRSVGICGIQGVGKLLREQRDEDACNLALACYKYISGHRESYRTPEKARLVLILGMDVADRSVMPKPEKANRKKMLETSRVILRDVLDVLANLHISLEKVSLGHLNRLVELLGEQQEFRTLSWLLTVLWKSREAQQDWHPATTFALGKQVILARYLVGESMSAVRLAEDIVYNCRRVHGMRHPSTLDMSMFLAQLYTSVAQRYQGQAAGREMAGRFYRKSAAIHENVLRVFSDPTFADVDGAGCGSNHGDFGGHNTIMGDVTPTESRDISEGSFVRQHLWHLKLALERLGGWANNYSEYERLNADVFRLYPVEMQGMEGVERWNLGNYGSGQAESQEDLLEAKSQTWGLTEPMISIVG